MKLRGFEAQLAQNMMSWGLGFRVATGSSRVSTQFQKSGIQDLQVLWFRV